MKNPASKTQLDGPAKDHQQSTIANPKRGTTERTGLHSWLPYYAGYSEEFVASILESYEIKGSKVVLDPMNGSGTTTLVAQKAGCLSVGVELNPVMAIISRAKDPGFLYVKEQILGFTDGLIKSLKNQTELIHRAEKEWEKNKPEGGYGNEDLAGDFKNWLSQEHFFPLQQLANAIQEQESARVPYGKLAPRFRKVIYQKSLQAPGGRPTDFLLAVLLRTARSFSIAEKSKNPTWLKQNRSRHKKSVTKKSIEDVLAGFKRLTTEMLDDLANAEFQNGPGHQRRMVVLDGDAKKLPIRNNSIDIIITSPPYLTRIDYAVSTSPELILLGYQNKEDLRNKRRELMGSTCVIPGKRDEIGVSTNKQKALAEKDLPEEWGKTCREFIATATRKNWKATKSYYADMHLQYFSDANEIVSQCQRTLKPGAHAFFVVQDSWYKNLRIPLNKIYVEMAELAGLRAETIESFPVRSHLGLTNRGARKYKKGGIDEHVVRFTKPNHPKFQNT